MIVHELFVYLCVPSANQAIAFYTRAFGGREKFRLAEPNGRVGHAEIAIGPHVVMLSEEFPESGFHAPKPGSTSSFVIHLHVDNADQVMAQAVAAGATVVRAAADEFYGERSGRIRDPFGHEWLIGHHLEDVSPEEMQRRYTALFS